jgi:hypothetical protein
MTVATATPPPEPPSEEGNDLNNGRSGQRLRIGQGFGHVAWLEPAASLDQIPVQQCERRTGSAESDGPDAQERPGKRW